MKQNVGAFDAAVRWALAAVFVALSLIETPSRIGTLVAAVVALILACTALTHTCPLYSLLGFGTWSQRRPRTREG